MNIEVADAKDIIAALRSGVVPARGLSRLAVGLESVMVDLAERLDDVAAGRSDFRMVLGAYGAGKSFLCGSLREAALSRSFAVSAVTVGADAPIGDMAVVYNRIVEGLRTRERLASCALQDIVERWLMSLLERSATLEGASLSRDTATRLAPKIEERISAAVAEAADADVGFARALRAYFLARLRHETGLARDALQWLRGSNRVPVESRRSLGIKGEVTSDNAFAMLVSLLKVVRLAGYRGTAITIDEAEIILRLPTVAQRQAAYETLRLIVDACGEAALPGAYLVVTGTEQLLHDKHVGIASYAALAQRIERPVAATTLDARRSNLLVLRGLDGDQLATVARTVRDIHGIAFGYDARQRLSDALVGELARQATSAFGGEAPRIPRRFLREVVYLCDLCEEHQGFDPATYVLGSAPDAQVA